MRVEGYGICARRRDGICTTPTAVSMVSLRRLNAWASDDTVYKRAFVKCGTGANFLLRASLRHSPSPSPSSISYQSQTFPGRMGCATRSTSSEPKRQHLHPDGQRSQREEARADHPGAITDSDVSRPAGGSRSALFERNSRSGKLSALNGIRSAIRRPQADHRATPIRDSGSRIFCGKCRSRDTRSTIIEARDLNEALELVSKFPARLTTVEVRPTMDPNAELTDPGDRTVVAAIQASEPAEPVRSHRRAMRPHRS